MAKYLDSTGLTYLWGKIKAAFQTKVTASGILKGDGSGGVTAATSGTDYQAAITASGVLKGNGSGSVSAATAGTDYQAAITATGILKGNGSGSVTTATAGTDYVASSELFYIAVTDSNGTLTADKTYAQIQAAISAGKELIATMGSYTFKQHFYVAASGCVFTSIGYNNNGPNEVILTVDPQDAWTFLQSQATCSSIGALPISGGTMTGQLTTSFGAVAMGTKGYDYYTLPDLAQVLRYSSGVAGSFSLSTAYEFDAYSPIIPVGWYNYLWIPHRSGGNSGQASGDNCDYGTLFLSGMTASLGSYSVRFTNGAIQQVMRLDNTSNAGQWNQPVYFYKGAAYAIDWYVSNSNAAQDCNAVTNNFCGYYAANGPSTAIGATTGDGALWNQAHSSSWMSQIASDYRTGNLFGRGKNAGNFTAWKRFISTEDIGRNDSLLASNTSYTTLMARAESLNSSDTNPSINGAISWTYS